MATFMNLRVAVILLNSSVVFRLNSKSFNMRHKAFHSQAIA